MLDYLLIFRLKMNPSILIPQEDKISDIMIK